MFFNSFNKNAFILLKHLFLREIKNNYTNSFLGIAWIIIKPLVIVMVYSLFFSTIFKFSWEKFLHLNNAQISLVVLIGLIPFYYFVEVINDSTNIIHRNLNIIKKINFPIIILPILANLTSLFNFFNFFLLYILALLYFTDITFLSILHLFSIVIPMIILLQGLCFLVVTFCIYFKDLRIFINIFLPTFIFITPIFYPIEIIPDYLRSFFYFNPLTFIVESLREIIFLKFSPYNFNYLIFLILSIFIFYFGFLIFNSKKQEFIDVI